MPGLPANQYAFTPLSPDALCSAQVDCGTPDLWEEYCAKTWAAPTYACVGCESTFEPAWDLAAQGKLPDWGAVLALTQNNGRGQLRRGWHSPPGNLYVSFRLPLPGIFSNEAASIFAGLMLCMAFEGLGLDFRLKWPNDLILLTPDGPRKVGGLLLEERGGVLIAGLGINCAHRPDLGQLRENAAVPAGILPLDWRGVAGPNLWNLLVARIIMVYDHMLLGAAEAELLLQAQKRLLWLDRDVFIQEHGAGLPLRGRLVGLSPQGGIVLRLTENGQLSEQVFFSGSLRDID